jgi:hypothetical protein
MRIGGIRLSVYSVFVFAFVAFVAVPAFARVLKADLNCDGQVDLDDYSLAVRGGSVDYGLFQTEFGSKDGDCKKTVSGNNTNTGSTATPSPSPSIAPTPTASSSGIKLEDPDLVAYFKMEDTASPIQNLKPNGSQANLIQMGTVTYGQEGKVGKGVKVGGVANAFCSGTGTTCADNDIYDFVSGTGSYTMGMWVKLNAYNATLFRKWYDGYGNYSYWIGDQKLFLAALAHPHPDWLYGYDKQRPYSPTGRSHVEGDLGTFPLGAWAHVIVVRDAPGKTVKIYVNGVAKTTKPGSVTQANGSIVESVMRGDNQNSTDFFTLGQFDGYIDEFFAYKKALTPAEVQTIYKSY